MKICLGRTDRVGRRDLWGIGEWGNVNVIFFPEISLNSNSQYYECNLVLSTSKFFKDKKHARASRGRRILIVTIKFT